jgi:uncharacterized protein (DUF58 family)
VDTPDRRSIALVVGTLLAIGGTVASFVPLTVWGLAVMVMSILATAWTKSAWRGVEVEAKFEPQRAFVGEPVRIRVRVRNGKRLPLPFVRIGVWLPRQLEPVGETGSAQIHGFRRRTTLAGHGEVVLEFEAITRRRGEYHLRVIEVDLSDPFALAPVHREFDVEGDLLVLPEPRIPIPVPVRRRLPFGTPSPAMRMFEQPERFAGVRAYQPGDPLNRIHWKLTGHAGDLQVKLFEPTRSADVLLAIARRDADAKIRAEAIYWVPQRGGTRVLGDVTAIIENDATDSVKTRAVDGLARLKADDSIPLLIQMARTNKNAAVRKQAVTRLGETKDPRALAFLEELIR